ncbi:hypothetical protein FQN49_003642 [Arthroderma sp. PD_2]|nr:hypothetical protein FQN49_003642 [Arthroderma sp. PD_2]
MDWRYTFITYLSAFTAHVLLLLVLVYVPPTSYLRAWLVPVLLVPTVIVAQTAVHATSVMPLNFIFGVGYGARLALEIFDLLCISKEAYPGYRKWASHKEKKTDEAALVTVPWHARCYSAINWLWDITSIDRRLDGYSAISRQQAALVSKRRFLTFRTIRFILGYLLLDFITAQSLEDAHVKFGPGKEKILSRIIEGSYSGQDLGETLGAIVGFALAGYLNLTVLFDFISVLAVGLGISDVEGWPPIFGPLSEMYSIRRFWRYGLIK